MERLNTPYSGELPVSSVRRLIRFCPIPEKSAVLDMTVGRDSPLRSLHRLCPEVSLSGICGEFDYFRGIRNELPDAELIFGKPPTLPWDDETFDAVSCSLSCIGEENASALSDAMRVLKHGGKLLIYLSSAPLALRRAVKYLKAQDEDGNAPISVRDAVSLLEKLGAENVSVHRVSLMRAVIVGTKPSIK